MAALSAVKLSNYSVENLVFRMIYVVNASEFASEYVEQSIPLVLGTDIINHSTLDAKNHCRCHMRYAKKGLATKVNFKDKRVDGINNGNALWFYNIKGMLKLSFECCDETMQRVCLQYFNEMWMDHQSDKNLSEHITLTVHRPETYNKSEMVIITLPENEVHVHISSQADSSARRKDEKEAAILSENLDIRNAAAKRDSSANVVCSNMATADIVGDVKVHVDADTCTCTCDAVVCRIVNSLGDCEQIVKSICSHIKDSKHCEPPFVRLGTLLGLYLLEGDGQTVFPFHLIEAYIGCIQPQAAPGFSQAARKTKLLELMSSWLGDEFCALQPTVAAKVDIFKSEHIGCIDDLPPPKELVKELFPQCMVNLVLSWMSHATPTSGESSAETPKKRQKPDRDSSIGAATYNVAQMALEFLNNTLVSGVAHVVFSRLLHS